MYSKIKKITNFIVFTIFSILIFSCAASKEFKLATTLNTIKAYESFVDKYPTNSKSQIAALRLKTLYENRDWETAKRINSSSSYKDFISNYPTSNRKSEAARLLSAAEKDEKMIADWNRAQGQNTVSAYEQFIYLNPNSRFNNQAKAVINGFIDKAWRDAGNSNTIEEYQNFLKAYPNSSYTQQARRKIEEIKDTNAWRTANSKNSISSYQDYLVLYPSGIYSSSAKSKIKSLEEEKYVLPAWKTALAKNTYEGYMSFYRLYSNSSYASEAKYKAEAFENLDWNKARNQNTISGYKAFISKYPYSERTEIAEKNIIDLEVANIFQGEHGYLPPMNKTSSFGYGQPRPTTNTIEISNDTAYELTVWYSGSSSKKIVLNPGRSTTFTLPNGAYKVAASVKASNVTKYAGNENLTGGSYESKFYIESRYGF